MCLYAHESQGICIACLCASLATRCRFYFDVIHHKTLILVEDYFYVQPTGLLRHGAMRAEVCAPQKEREINGRGPRQRRGKQAVYVEPFARPWRNKPNFAQKMMREKE